MDDVRLRVAFCFPDTYEIGMSNLGMRILYGLMNEMEGVWCERVFAPWADMQEQMEKHNLPLWALESQDPVKDFDMIAFTIGYEMSYTNILNMLRLAQVPLHAAQRQGLKNIVFAGGVCAFNPEPLADYIDFFSLGEGEDITPEILKVYDTAKAEGWTKEHFLREVSRIPGVYVPSFYRHEYAPDGTLARVVAAEGAPERITKRIIEDLDSAYFPTKMIVPSTEIVHDRANLEVFRGCIRGCRFCQAGFSCRPVRKKSADVLFAQAKEIIADSGNNEITLSYGGFSAKITLVGREKTTYQIVFIGKDGTVLLSQSYEEGQAVTPPTPPVVEGYTFTGWDKEITAANANTTYVAIYTLNTPGTPDPPEEQTYQIIFIGRNGVVLSSENYTAGQTVTVPTPPAVNGYTFVGWDKVITVANANTVYTAIYEAIPSYLITFLGRDNTVLSAEYYNQDQTVTPPTPPTVEGYTFVGWNKTVTAATANAVYVAVYRADAPEVSEADRARLAKADTNGDGVITHEDAVLLLQRVHFGEVVLYASGDINNDGRLTSDDAIRLEKYVQDPEANPIG